jgi:hypothetical protein
MIELAKKKAQKFYKSFFNIIINLYLRHSCLHLIQILITFSTFLKLVTCTCFQARSKKNEHKKKMEKDIKFGIEDGQNLLTVV